MAKYRDLTGQKYGKLTVKEGFNAKDLGYAGGGVYWRCECECGGERLARTHDLIHGHIKSCGCYKDETMREIKRVLEKDGMAQLEKFRLYLCEKYERKCYTNPMGKCPLANDECWNFINFREMYTSRNFIARKELMTRVVVAIENEGYELHPNG